MEKTLKIFNGILSIIFISIIIIGGIFIVLYIVGIEPFVVLSGSMEPTIKTGSLSFINKHHKYENIKQNDVIAFSLPTGAKVTHRVINITDEGFETKGDKNEDSDGIITTKSNYLGKNIFSIPKVGYAVKLSQTIRGKIIIFTIITIILVYSFFSESKKTKLKKIIT